MDKALNFKQLDKSVRKQAIIDAAAELFHKKGYSATSLDDVAKVLGISKPALYHYVKNKNELLTIIYTQAFENIFRDTYEISNMELAPDEKLRRIIRHHITNIIMKDLYMFSVFFSEENQLPKKDFIKIREEKRRYTAIFEKIIAEGMALNVFVKKDPKLQVYAIIGMCNWIYKWFRVGRSEFNSEEIGEHFIYLLEHGYLASHSNHPPEGDVRLPLNLPESLENKKAERKLILEEIRRHAQVLNELAVKLDSLND